MHQVLITVASSKLYSSDYPFAVVIKGPDGKVLQETGVRSVRDGRIYANGICLGGGISDQGVWPVNPTLDPRLVCSD